MANWSNPVLTSTYTDVLSILKDRDVDLALQFDGVTPTNLPTGAVRWNSTINRWQKWSGSAWGELTTTYALTGLSTTGNASIGGTFSVTGSTALATATATTPSTADNSTNIATTAYVRAQGYVAAASPALTGTPTAPTATLGTNTTQIATTAFVNAEIANDAVLLTGSTMTGALTLSGDPTAENHATTKHWVEARSFKDSCRVATTAALTVTATATTLTNAGTLAAISIDGIALSVGDRVLVKDQAASAQNGIYTVTTVGTASVAWVLTRGTDSDVWSDLISAVVAIDQGTVNDNTSWLSTTATGGTLGSTAVTWQMLSNAQLAAIGVLSTNGLLTRTGAGTAAARSIAVSGTGLSIANADGVSGNPTVTSNATSTGTTSGTIIARGTNGDFSAGTITGVAFIPNGSTAPTNGIYLPAANTVAISSNSTGRVFISPTGDVGIGTNSPTSTLDVRGGIKSTNGTNAAELDGSQGGMELLRTTGDAFIDFKNNTADDFDVRIQQLSNGLRIDTGGSGATAERVRIDSTGKVYARAASTDVAFFSTGSAASTTDNLISGKHSSTTVLDGTEVFRVRTNGNVQNANNSYGSTSDINLKENIVDATSQWSDIKALRVRKYNFKEGQTHTQIGVIAQEVELISPGLVTESKDRDDEGNDLGTVTKSVSYSVLYMKAVKALQEAMERIEALEAKVKALEG